MKKIILILMTLVLFLHKGQSQIDYSKIIVPANVTTVDFQEKLVQLAWKNHPSNRIVENEVEIQRQILKQDRRDWTRGFAVSGNLNEFVLNEEADVFDRSAFFPKYNISGRLDLGLLFVSPLKKKENEYRVRVAEENINMQKLEIRNTVLNAYQDYIKFLEFYKIQSEIAQDAYSEYLVIEQRFKNGDATTDQFNQFLRASNLQRKEKINAENQYLKSKNDLEYYIGVKIEDLF